jgi:putative endonuclease
MYYVYLIQSLSPRGERYVGITTDLKRRFQEHNQGKSSHITKFGPWKLITYIAFSNRAKAEARALSQIRFRSCIREKAPM